MHKQDKNSSRKRERESVCRVAVVEETRVQKLLLEKLVMAMNDDCVCTVGADDRHSANENEGQGRTDKEDTRRQSLSDTCSLKRGRFKAASAAILWHTDIGH